MRFGDGMLPDVSRDSSNVCSDSAAHSIRSTESESHSEFMFVGSWAFALLADILLGLGTILRNMKARNLKKRCRGFEESRLGTDLERCY